jgi:hypothetical protein
MAVAERLPTDEELYPLASILARRFIQRWDCYAKQLDDGRYVCVHTMLSPSLLVDHLRGKVTLGTYLLNIQSNAKFVVLDADDENRFARLIESVKTLTSEGAPGYLERSRRGGHLWFFFAQTISGRDARAFGNGIVAKCQLDGVELYPKQEHLDDGPGSLIRLPFGIHRRTGRRYGFITPEGKPLAPSLRDQLTLFASARPVSNEAFSAYESVASGTLPREPLNVSETNATTVSGRIKAATTVLEFVSQYVDLSDRGVGKCPFHQDEHESFAVNDSKDYWNCFAGCGGGSVIDFAMKWRASQGLDGSFIATIKDLAQTLL